jgi:hypothetical protein
VAPAGPVVRGTGLIACPPHRANPVVPDRRTEPGHAARSGRQTAPARFSCPRARRPGLFLLRHRTASRAGAPRTTRALACGAVRRRSRRAIRRRSASGTHAGSAPRWPGYPCVDRRGGVSHERLGSRTRSDHLLFVRSTVSCARAPVPTADGRTESDFAPGGAKRGVRGPGVPPPRCTPINRGQHVFPPRRGTRRDR